MPTKTAVDESLLVQAKDALAALKIPAEWQVEIYLERKRFREVAWAEGRAEDTVSGRTQGLALRAISKGRQGFASANEISHASAKSLWEAARASAALLPADPARQLPAVQRTEGEFPADPALFTMGVKDLQRRLAGLEKSLLASNRLLSKVLRLSIHESLRHRAVVNTRGVAVESSAGAVSVSTELMGEKKGEVQVAWSSAQKTRWEDVDFDAPLAAARERVVSAFGADRIPSGSVPVLMDPWVGVEFLELLARGFRGESVQRGRSPVAGKKGQVVASPLVTIVDDPRLPHGLESSIYDDEGVATRRVTLLKDGAVREFFHDAQSAAREGVESTGHAGRGGYSAPPSAGPSNLFLAPGKMSLEKLVAETGRAFWVKDVLGMHTADAVSGDFSVGASGLLVEKGRVTRPVKGVTLAGNILEMLKRVDGVADDLTWHGSVGAPTFRVSGLAVGGS